MQLKLSDAIKKMHRKYAGDTKYPATTTDKYTSYVDIINELKDQWATDPENQWESCWEERELGTTTTALTYDLAEDISDLSDFVYIDTTDGETATFKVLKKTNRTGATNCVYLHGSDPKQMTFTNMPEECVGGTIRAGIYAIPDNITRPNQLVPVDRPMWVVLAGAAELAFNDTSREDKYPDLNEMANDEYSKMITANENTPEHQTQSVPQGGYAQAGGWGL